MKDKVLTFIFIIYILIFSILGIIIKDEKISNTERRYLKTFPNYNFESSYPEEIEKYLLDHFPYRDSFRNIKANFSYNFLKKLDNNGIYLKDNYIFKTNYPLNKKSVTRFVNLINNIKNQLTSFNHAYLIIVPDKNYYLNDPNFLNIDYDYIYNKVNEIDVKKIDIRNILTLNDYYETDTHWKSENLDKVVYEMSKVMDFDYKKSFYTKNIYDNFYGVYYGESALNRESEKLTYLTNDIINNAYVDYLENPNFHGVYNTKKLDSFDPYNIFLDGASSFIEIYNTKSNTSRNLVIFRDSFGSSITPLLINYYRKITLIDTRYINSENYQKLINFDNQDVLFMYSTLLVNDCISMKE